MNIEIIRKLQKWFTGALIIYGIFLFYQLMRKILGGSWNAEELLIGVVLFNLGLTFTIAMLGTEVKTDQNHFKAQFSTLANDFKATRTLVEQNNLTLTQHLKVHK